ncbi:MAG: excisionase family DNA-binding protein [Bryobacteraceae bacterium]
MAERAQTRADGLADSPSSRISAQEIAQRLNVGRLAVYAMLEQGIIPAVRLGRRWIITRQAYLAWERTCDRRAGAGLRRRPEVVVVN